MFYRFEVVFFKWNSITWRLKDNKRKFALENAHSSPIQYVTKLINKHLSCGGFRVKYESHLMPSTIYMMYYTYTYQPTKTNSFLLVLYVHCTIVCIQSFFFLDFWKNINHLRNIIFAFKGWH